MNFRILELCKEQGINQTELAEKIGLSRVGLSKAINGNPTVETLSKIANALKVDITDLFTSNKQDLYGHIEYKGQVYTIKSRSDLENLLKMME